MRNILYLVRQVNIKKQTIHNFQDNYSKFLDMDTLCGKLITLNGDTLPGTYFSLTSGKYRQNLNCILTIKASTTHQRLIIVMDKMDVVCGDKLLIYDGKKSRGLILNKDESLQCGRNKYYYRVNSNFFCFRILERILDKKFQYCSN